ncbi:transcriptional regulator, TetR family [Hymenobacter roseosalivarius DSM 11622]|uniref:Transcriptional regulator, TetR family n=1 Tax=Hymenobacter roseosalivarius DSM 11622 TaxID=645990 RepID=A0A1W1UY26_9BACT|nr:TetR/AcrR family transcriptional regulator [Hymenobacter roseosalivarius]SMB85976.1 transcriptional regulator, TetR family [Hymenobacter roseosalivarius DSM 11622]
MEIKDRILQSAQTLFMRNGIKSVSMDDIATHLAMSKKTLYKWFENKDQIVHAVIVDFLSHEEADCAGMAASAGNALEELFQMMEWSKQLMTNIHPSIFYDLQKFHSQAWQVWVAHKNQFILEKITDNLRRGIAEGLYRADLDVDVLARLRLAQIELAFNADFYPPRQFDPQRVQHICLEHFMLGSATLRGHKLINKYRQVTEEE